MSGGASTVKSLDQVYTLLSRITSSFAKSTSRDHLVGEILEVAIQATQGDRGTVFLSPKTGRRKTDAATQLVSYVATGLVRPIQVDSNKGVVGHVYSQRQPLMVADAKKDSRFFSEIDQGTGYETKTLLAAPVLSPRGEVLGVIEILNSRVGQFDQSDLQILQVISLFAGIALESSDVKGQLDDERKTRQASLEKLIETAELTNRRSTHADLREIYAKLPDYAQSDSSVLIEGESGTGKEVVAQILHARSNRATGAFVAVNCSAIPESLFEAEMFGVAEGAATGAKARKGFIEQADGGTLFLDELGEMPLAMQAKMLRVLQERVVSRVGSDRLPQEVDFRVVAATNRQLKAQVSAGKFREDLYYRLNVIQLTLPPLRERKGDIPSLCEGMIERICRERGWKKKQLGSDALLSLQEYVWPGNLRQLQNRLESALIASGDRQVINARDVQLEELPPAGPKEGASASSGDENWRPAIGGWDLKLAKDQLEKQMIERALGQTQGNRSEAARLLGMTREGLRKALIKLGVATK